MKKKILLGLGAMLAVVAGVAALSAFEAHVINVTAHIENALNVDNYGLDFGTVFPQENLFENFTVSLSDSFVLQNEATEVDYKIVQKPKHWRDEFDGIAPLHRSLAWIDPDNNGSYTENAGNNGLLIITTGNDEEDLFGANEQPHDWTAPRKMMRIGGNFTIETKVTANPLAYPGNDYQSGGILVYESDGNVVRLELTAFTGLGPSNAVYMESQKGASKTGKGWNAVGSDTVYLRLSRNGDTFKGEYSLDGIAWNPVTTQEGNFENENIEGYPLVGVAVVDNDELEGSVGFSASFEYVDVNGNYQDFCKFLSKMNEDKENGGNNDVSHPSYYVPAENLTPAYCTTSTPEASGILDTTIQDFDDTWTVDLKVPPIAGYVGQDWPASCRQDWVVPAEDDYGCDLWVEVTGINRAPR